MYHVLSWFMLAIRVAEPRRGAAPRGWHGRITIDDFDVLSRAEPRQAKDSDNETALEAILSLSQEEPEEEALKVLHGAAWQG